ncbi:conserved hypothetical protein [Sulfolobus islandicus Y.N.15.51]|uniref:EVE domain-containing protein n=1 Tax=Saccharolobus islandicus (strain Y.N.15.51 / Yellowstone \|nr:hypothetical protein [Sulfolobus islandicus]ACP49269.1 conserved hypothetical protein [Sulfolobus islandicus Y.N.15.51]
MYVLFKGTLTNFLFSLDDYKTRKSKLIQKYPQGSFIWGFNRSSKLLENQVRAFLYLNKSESHLKGGIVLEGEIIDIAELSEKYWPEGEWKYYVTLKIIYIPKSVLSTTDTTRWKIIGLDKLKEIGVKILPGIQKIDNELGRRIEKLLGEIDAN